MKNLVIGVDVSKDKLDYCVYTGEVVTKGVIKYDKKNMTKLFNQYFNYKKKF